MHEVEGYTNRLSAGLLVAWAATRLALYTGLYVLALAFSAQGDLISK